MMGTRFSARTAGELRLTVSYSFEIGSKAYIWNWNVCTRDADGIGLPGHDGCGDPVVSATASCTG
jgi:hypothetical protein